MRYFKTKVGRQAFMDYLWQDRKELLMALVTGKFWKVKMKVKMWATFYKNL